jgi:hypothetical protein
MEFESVDGHYVELAVTGHQFGARQSSSEQPDWDANWLMIQGKVWDGDRSWTFHDPCLTTWEARELASWLRGLGHASAKVVEATAPDELRLWMTEPNLTFELNKAAQGMTTLGATLSSDRGTEQ